MARALVMTDTIPNAGSLTTGVDLADHSIVGIVMPAAWTAAGISFRGSIDGTNYFTLVDATGAEITVTSPAASDYVALSQPMRDELEAVRFLQLRSGTNAAPVNQGAARVMTLIVRAEP